MSMTNAAESPQSARLRIAGAMLSDVGRVRTLNEDSVAFVVPAGDATTDDKDSLLLVADGMGGHAAGEVASALASEVVRRVFFSLKGEAPDLLRNAFDAANEAILDYGQQNPESAGLGTTCTALAVRGGQIWLAHVGDSRAYLLRGGALTQLSQDQTLVAKMVRDGDMTADEARISIHSNIILQALGTKPDVEPEIWTEGLPIAPGDAVILCTDGLHGLVSDEVIAEIAGRLAPGDACAALIQKALDAGGHDNVSVGVFRLSSTGEVPDARKSTETRQIKAFDAPTGETDDLSRATRRLPVFARQP
jgi:PPM family protein phosphatase